MGNQSRVIGRTLDFICYFPIDILCQVWYLIVSIPDLSPLPYFYVHVAVF